MGYRVGTRGSDRPRLLQKQTFDCLLSLAFLSMTDLALELRGSDIGAGEWPRDRLTDPNGVHL